jgi:hypothetical protein
VGFIHVGEHVIGASPFSHRITLMEAQRVDTMLSRTVSRAEYLAAEQRRDQAMLSAFVHDRFAQRYLLPFKQNPNKNGFIMMASACLMIEALESFWNGWKKSPNSALAFCQFFDRVDRFAVFRGRSHGFYVNVRCGIMHQGETTGGWHIRRDLSALFDPASLTVDATRFLAELAGYLSDYRQMLHNSGWDAPVWKGFRKKMQSVCANTKA